MFHMMNEARVGVGLSGAVLALRGYRVSLDYALERIQGRDRATGQPVAIVEHADVKRMLLAQKSLAEGALALVLYAARLIDEQATGDEPERTEAGLLLALLTPVVKTFPSEFMQESLHLAIQVLGGAGYTRDFGVEMYYRDNRLNPIHEGTTGIQALDLVGRKLRRDRGQALGVLRKRVDRTLADALRVPELADAAIRVQAAFEKVMAVVRELTAAPEDERLHEGATPFLYAFGHATVAWLWLDQALCCVGVAPDPGGADFYAGKLRAMRYFVEVELPRAHNWLEQVEQNSSLAATMPVAQF